MSIRSPQYGDLDWTTSAQLEKLALDDEPWTHYLDTAVYLENAAMRGTVRPVADSIEDDPPFGELHVITSIQPDADPQSHESATRLQILTNHLLEEGIEAIRAVGSSFDGVHREESRAVFGLDDDRAREIGRMFGQVAVFAWRGRSWSLLACATDRQSHMAWRWQAERTDQTEGAPHE